ncbi:cytochrome c4 [Legionella israelensis]|uniref:Cytochrome c4 n=1 Tax=Legionella israelensis TaxID=454 RepID=A0A0W0WJW4_9GAMM|nr:c-type cytochrome [Legionella israelensis]KTD32600.1 cytochrome c4 [Legionella israelensis]QBR85240.1 cytochrome c4 [Legionella israelensis]QBS09856.1 cytochrome c4 [Legionella israelensis]QDP71345.1 cytochrome c4 [Legionella israelensis]SCY17824.1 Cytochrome c553 [Legionella israelensis DSM 19235]
MKKLALAFALSIPFAVYATGNIEAGQQKATICVACHGPKGISVNPAWPNLAGQHADYMVKQLKAYKEGKKRSDPNMDSIAANLSEQDMEDLAAFYSVQPLAKAATPEKFVSRGEQLYRGGDFKNHITACIACHGPRGLGNGQANFPLLSGQHALYTQTQLEAFKDKKRTNDLNDIMQDISARMSQEDMQAVAYYIQGLH